MAAVKIVKSPVIKDVELPENEAEKFNGLQYQKIDAENIKNLSGFVGQVVISGVGGSNVDWNETLVEILPNMNDDTISDTVALYIQSTIGAGNSAASPTGIVIATPVVNGTIDTGAGIRIFPQGDGAGNDTAVGLYIDSHAQEATGSRVISINGRGIQNGIAFSPGDLYVKDDLTERLAFDTTGLEAILSGVIFSQTADATVANTGTETTLIGTGVGTVTLPADVLFGSSGSAGRTLRITARGIYGTDAITPGNLNLRVKLGATTICTTGNVAATAALTNRFWELTAYITCRTQGAAGTVLGNGGFLHDDALATSELRIWQMINTGTTTIDTTASLAIDVTADWDTADAQNTITCQVLVVEILN